MFRFIKKVFISAMKFFSFKVLNVNPLEVFQSIIKNVKQDQK